MSSNVRLMQDWQCHVVQFLLKNVEQLVKCIDNFVKQSRHGTNRYRRPNILFVL